jgi:hypothetical protein
MRIPIFLKFGTIFIDGLKKQGMEEPEVCRLGNNQAMKSFEPMEKSSPSASKLRSYLDPKLLNPYITGRAMEK